MTGKRLSLLTPVIRVADADWPEGGYTHSCGCDGHVLRDDTRPASHTGRATITPAEGAVS